MPEAIRSWPVIEGAVEVPVPPEPIPKGTFKVTAPLKVEVLRVEVPETVKEEMVEVERIIEEVETLKYV